MSSVYNVYAVNRYNYEKYGVHTVVCFLGKSEEEFIRAMYPPKEQWLTNIRALQGLHKLWEEPFYLDKSWPDFPLLLKQLRCMTMYKAFKEFVVEVPEEQAWMITPYNAWLFFRRLRQSGEHISTEREIDNFYSRMVDRMDDDFFSDFGGKDYALYLLGYLRDFLKYGLKWADKEHLLIIVS